MQHSKQEENQDTHALNRGLDAIQDLDRFVEIAWQGLGIAENALRIAKTLADPKYRRRAEAHDLTIEEEKNASKLEAFAAEQKPDFPFLHSLAAFRLWAILETTADDLVLERLREDQSLWRKPIFMSIEGSLVQFTFASPTEQTEMLVTRLKQKLGAQLKIGVGRFEALFEAVDIAGEVADLPRKVLLELSEVRNVTAHRNGRADARFLERCPWYEIDKGETVRVTHPDFVGYKTAAHWYLVELFRRLAVSSSEQQRMLELREFLHNRLSELKIHPVH